MNLELTQEQYDAIWPKLDEGLSQFIKSPMNEQTRQRIQDCVRGVFDSALHNGILHDAPRVQAVVDGENNSVGFKWWEPNPSKETLYREVYMGGYSNMLDLCGVYPERAEWIKERWRIFEERNHCAESEEEIAVS